MNRKPAPLARWWHRLDLQVRLFLVFTVLFAFSALCISAFLRNVIQISAIHTRAQNTFERNRRVYRLQLFLLEYEQALNDYENNPQDTFEERLYAKADQIDESVAALKSELPAALLPALDDFAKNKGQLAGVITQVVEAVKQQNLDEMKKQDDNAYDFIKPMYAELKQITTSGVEELDTIEEQANGLNTFIIVSIVAAALLYAILATVTALVITLQINQPLETLTQACKDLLAGRFTARDLDRLTARSDKVGEMAREFVHLAESADQRTAELQKEAEEMRAMIR